MTDTTSPPTSAPDASDGAETTTYDVPPDREAAHCDYCGRPFASESLLALHRGQAHPDAVTDEERSTYESVYGAETKQLRRFRLKALIVLIVVYFGLLMVYAVV